MKSSLRRNSDGQSEEKWHVCYGSLSDLLTAYFSAWIAIDVHRTRNKGLRRKALSTPYSLAPVWTHKSFQRQNPLLVHWSLQFLGKLWRVLRCCYEAPVHRWWGIFPPQTQSCQALLGWWSCRIRTPWWRGLRLWLRVSCRCLVVGKGQSGRKTGRQSYSLCIWLLISSC